ncbi:MAG: hypothetical protein V4565_12040 [Bacteroidota bacterium]
MKQFDKFEQIKNELLGYSNDFKRQGKIDISRSIFDTASLIKELIDTYKKSSYSYNEVLKLKIKINHNFNYLKYSMKSQDNGSDSNTKADITNFVLRSFNRYYDFFQFDQTIGMA